MATTRELTEAVDQILDVVTRRGDELSPQVKSELALMLNDLSAQIQAQKEVEEVAPLVEEAVEAPLPAQPPSLGDEDVGARVLWTIAGGNEEAFLNYLQTFPDPSLQALIRNPAQLESLIANLKQRYPQPAPAETAEGLEEPQYQSSNVEGFKYDPRVRRLVVKFHGGSVYQYANVPPVFAQMFMTGNAECKTTGKNKYGSWWKFKRPSMGAALNEWIKKGGFSYQKVS